VWRVPVSKLAKALDERLSVSVAPLTDTDLESGALLTQFISQNYDAGINLYPAHLQPKVDHFTLNNVALASALLIVIMCAAFGYNTWQHTQLTQDLSVVKSQEKEFNQQLVSFERLKEDILSKRDSLNAVSKYDGAQQAGYSGIMASLAQLGRNDISINYIHMDDDTLDIKGLARDPQAIPNLSRMS